LDRDPSSGDQGKHHQNRIDILQMLALQQLLQQRQELKVIYA
jgi:hypothetical protein